MTDNRSPAPWEMDWSGVTVDAGDAKAAQTPDELEAVRREALDKIKLARSLKQRSRDGWFATGFGADAAASFGGTGAYDVRQDAETLKSAGALTRIMEMSATNGGKNPLTPLSNSDFKALSDSLSNIDTSQSDEQFQRNVDRVEQLYLRAYEGAGGKDIDNEIAGKAPVVGQTKGGDPSSSGGNTPTSPGPNDPAALQDGTAVVSQDGSSQFATERDAQFGAAVQSAFDQGASKADLDALAVSWGFNPYGVELNRAIEYRDKGGKGARILPPKTGYKGPSLTGTLAATGTGTFFAGAANALTGNSLPAIVELTGGDGEQAAQNMDVMQDAHPVADFMGNVAGAALATTGLGALTKASPLAVDVGYGAIYGSGEDDPILGTLVGAGAALAGHAVTQKVADAAKGLTSRRAAGRASRSAFAEAADRQGIDYLAADVPGATGARMASGLTKMTLGGIPLAEAAEKSIATAKAARDRIAGGLGAVRDTTGAGQAAQRGAKQFVRETADKGRDLYERIPIKSDTPTILTNTRETLARITQGLESNPRLSRLWAENARLKETLEALKTPKTASYGNPIGGGLNWGDLKRFRTIIGEIADQPSLSSDGAERASIKSLYGALSEDMRATATAAGPQALRAFERANTYWRSRQARIESSISQILGNDLDKAPDAAFRRIEQLAKKQGGDPIGVARMIRSLPEDEANSVRATILSRLGNVSAGRQDAEQAVFSPADFMTHWSQLSDRSKAILFTGPHRQALDDVVLVADGMKHASEFANTSKTTLNTNALALAGLFWTNPLAGVSAAAGQLGAGKLLGNPAFAKWLARAPKKPNPAARLAHVNQLSSIARSNPVIASDALGLQTRLAEAFTQTPLRAAAGEQERN